MNLFSDEMRRSPWAVYDHLRATSPLFRVPPPFNAWMLFDYESVKKAVNDHETFSSQVPAPKNWFLFLDPPAHTKQRALIASAFTPGVVAGLEPRIRELCRSLLQPLLTGNEVDFATDFATPFPMQVIADIIGIAREDWPRYYRWSDTILELSHSRSGTAEAEKALTHFRSVTVEMDEYLTAMIAERKAAPRQDLLTRLMAAEVDGERLTQPEILGFFQLLLVGGQETTANLLNNALLSLLEFPDQMQLLRDNPRLIPAAIEETLRFRSPIQWLMRTPKRAVELHGQQIKPGELVLLMIGSANRDPNIFPDANRFDIQREPNPHIAFGRGIHSCLGAALTRMEARIALGDLLEGTRDIQLVSSAPWPPRQALQVYGPQNLPLRLVAK